MLVNLMQRDVFVVGPGGRSVKLPACDNPVWCDLDEEVVTTECIGDVNVEIMEVEARNFINLPEPEDGTYLIVPKPVALAAWERQDLVFSTGIVTDEQGAIIGCRRFRRP